LLCEKYPADASHWSAQIDEFLAWRLAAVLPEVRGRDGQMVPADDRSVALPKVARRSMVPLKIERQWRRPRRPREERLEALGKRDVRWTRVAARRRLLLLVLVWIPSVIA